MILRGFSASLYGEISACMKLRSCTNNRQYMVSIHLLCWKKVQFYSVASYKPWLDIIQMTLAPVTFVQLIHILSWHRKIGIFHAYARGKKPKQDGAEMLLQRFTHSCISRRECFCCLQHFFSLQNCQNRKSCFLMCFVWAQFVQCVREVSHLVVWMRCGWLIQYETASEMCILFFILGCFSPLCGHLEQWKKFLRNNYVLFFFASELKS